jgi:hypothetical protein
MKIAYANETTEPQENSEYVLVPFVPQLYFSGPLTRNLQSFKQWKDLRTCGLHSGHHPESTVNILSKLIFPLANLYSQSVMAI